MSNAPIPTPPIWNRWLPEWLHGPVKLAAMLALVVLAGITGVATTYGVLSAGYDIDEVAAIPAGILICDRHGEPLEVAGAHGHRLATRQQLPDFLVSALQAREDARFFSHHGIDHRGLARATLRNLRDLNFTQGASTLTMQLARNCYDIRGKSGRGKLHELHRKLLEIAISLRIESRYSKDEILIYYLNRIYFGAGAHGIAQAADTYFGKPVADLTDSECALLVGIIRGPHVFSPARNLDGAIEQRRQTLERMEEMGFIDEAVLAAVADEAVRLVKEEDRESQTSYAVAAVHRELERLLDEETASLGGLTVVTTLDRAWQERLERELNQAVEGLEQEDSWKHPTLAEHSAGAPKYLQYAAITTETRTGDILAWIGGRHFPHSPYDRTQAKRDLGSAFEPFVAAAVAENEKLVIPGKPLQSGRQVGLAEVERVAALCGLEGPFTDNEDLYRGAVLASPLEMTVGLATLAHEGQRPTPYLVREIRNRAGEVIHRAEPVLTQAIRRDAALDALRVLRHRSGTRIFTGATASERDAWTLRLGPSGSTAIWIGFDRPQAIAGERRLKQLLDEFVERLGNG